MQKNLLAMSVASALIGPAVATQARREEPVQLMSMRGRPEPVRVDPRIRRELMGNRQQRRDNPRARRFRLRK